MALALSISEKFRTRFISAAVLGPLIIIAIIIGGWSFTIMTIFAYAVSVYEWTALAKVLPHRVRHILFIILYLSICFISFYSLRFHFSNGVWLTIAAMLSVWGSDTGAYIIGKKFGKRRMAPRLSPNKTWAGLLGAMIFSGLVLVLVAILYSMQATIASFTLSSYVLVFIGGCLLGSVGQIGDLLVSYYKRRAGVKDTGNLIPGHGGLLDRIDALLLVVPVFVAGVWICLK